MAASRSKEQADHCWVPNISTFWHVGFLWALLAGGEAESQEKKKKKGRGFRVNQIGLGSLLGHFVALRPWASNSLPVTLFSHLWNGIIVPPVKLPRT